MKKIQWSNPNRQLIETGHKTFDAQTSCISTGNVYGSTQTSSYIRSRFELECNGFTNAEGHLQSWDFNNWKNLPNFVRQAAAKVANENNGCILYKFFSYSHDKQIVHGWIITKTHEFNHEFVRMFYSGRGKSFGVMETVKDYVSNPAKENLS